MKFSKGIREDGIVVGNAYDKYGSNNPVVRMIMKGFTETLTTLIVETSPKTIHEVGCGEGHWVINWCRQGLEARGSDFSKAIIDIARENARNFGVAPDNFTVKSIYDVEPGHDSADLIVCCEVLEHLANPDAGLAALHRVVRNYLILSVPREPIWRVLNIARGKYLKNLGNTPGHIQHWSTAKFRDFVRKYFDILETKTPLPWTILLCRTKR